MRNLEEYQINAGKVNKSDGKVIYIEVKNEKGRLREKQKHFINTMQNYPVIIGVCRSPEDAIRLVTES